MRNRLRTSSGFTTLIASLVVTSLVWPANSGAQTTPGSPAATSVATEVVASAHRLEQVQVELGFQLLLALTENTKANENTQISPASVARLFAFVEQGADDAMRRALTKTLRLRPQESNAVMAQLRASASTARDGTGPLAVADALFVNSLTDLRAGVVDRMVAEGMEFREAAIGTPEGMAEINAWVSLRTRGLIPALLAQPVDAVLVAVNALYFKDGWSEPFNPRRTAREDFQGLDGPASEVDMMHIRSRFEYAENGRFAAVRLPYLSAGFDLVIVTTPHGPRPLSAFLDSADLLTNDRFEWREVDLALPKFKISAGADLLPALGALGLAEGVASPTALGGFSHIALRIGSILQKSVIDVDERGTEAAAATAMVAVTGVLPPDTDLVRLIVSQPFVFALRDTRRGLILLMGYVGQPTAG